MNNRQHSVQAFTLVELLTVIAIIGILAALLLPALQAAIKNANVRKAQTEEQGLVHAIEKYDSDYGRFPVSTNAQNASNPDFTYGGTFQIPGGSQQLGTPVSTSGVISNDEVMAILLDLTNYPNTTTPTVNANYQKNPQQTIFLQPHMNGDPKAAQNLTPGVGPDLVYRDPWGNPYIITMDLNYDDMCVDALYAIDTVSGGGLNGLIHCPAKNGNNNWAYRGKVMVWSAGPDGKIDPNVAANQGFNKDNVLSWK